MEGIQLEFFEQVGNFNFCNESELTTQWYVTLKNEEGKPIKIDDKYCRLFWTEEGDQRGKYTLEDDGLDYLVSKSFEYAKHVWGTTNYKAQTMLFVNTYNLYSEEIAKEFEEKRKSEIHKQIETLKSELNQAVLDGSQLSSNTQQLI